MLAEKKSAIDLTELAVGIIILGIVVSIGAVVLSTMGITQITNAGTYSVVNESVTAGTSFTLSQTWVSSVTSYKNATTGAAISSGNYTVSVNPETGVATLTNATCNAPYCGAPLKVTYTVYNTSDPRYDVPSNATVGLAEYGNWFKILVIVGIAGVILAILFMAFGGRKGGAAVSY